MIKFAFAFEYYMMYVKAFFARYWPQMAIFASGVIVGKII